MFRRSEYPLLMSSGFFFLKGVGLSEMPCLQRQVRY
jgi:hypothetical protein